MYLYGASGHAKVIIDILNALNIALGVAHQTMVSLPQWVSRTIQLTSNVVTHLNVCPKVMFFSRTFCEYITFTI